MSNVSSWLVRLVWRCAITTSGIRLERRGSSSADVSEPGVGEPAAHHESNLIRRLLGRFWAWMLEPVPFPRDHWYEEDRRRLARRRPPSDAWIASGLGMALAVSLALDSKAPAAAADGAGSVCQTSSSSLVVRAAWHGEETANFRVWAAGSQQSTQNLAARCEAARLQLRRTWLPAEAEKTWSPKCVVVVHGDLKSYRQAIGRPRDLSAGLATYDVEKRQIVSRRIDMRWDVENWWASALPHELTHLVLADALGGRAPPCWLGEGLAVLSESRSKQNQRALEVRRAAASRTVIPAARLLALEGLPEAHLRAQFYGQSASLVAFLIHQAGSQRLLEFIEASRRSGTEAALFEIYGIDDIETLNESWNIDKSPQQHCDLLTSPP